MRAHGSVSLAATAAFALSLVPAVLRPQTSTPQIMREKMDHAQELLRTIVLGELGQAEERANELHRLAELQSWYVLPTPEYAEHSKAFREAVRAVAEACEAGDLDAAFEAYSSSMRQCVQCHEYMRRVRSRAPLS